MFSFSLLCAERQFTVILLLTFVGIVICVLVKHLYDSSLFRDTESTLADKAFLHFPFSSPTFNLSQSMLTIEPTQYPWWAGCAVNGGSGIRFGKYLQLCGNRFSACGFIRQEGVELNRDVDLLGVCCLSIGGCSLLSIYVTGTTKRQNVHNDLDLGDGNPPACQTSCVGPSLKLNVPLSYNFIASTDEIISRLSTGDMRRRRDVKWWRTVCGRSWDKLNRIITALHVHCVQARVIVGAGGKPGIYTDPTDLPLEVIQYCPGLFDYDSLCFFFPS